MDGPAMFTIVESSRSMMFAANTTANTIQRTGLRVTAEADVVGEAKVVMVGLWTGPLAGLSHVAGTSLTRADTANGYRIIPVTQPKPMVVPPAPGAVAVIETTSPSSRNARLDPSASLSGRSPFQVSSISDPRSPVLRR